MTTPPPQTTTTPPHWTAEEIAVFAKLKSDGQYDPRSDAERKPGAFTPKPDLSAKISGGFLSDLIRMYLAEMPMGIQIRGLLVTGKVNIENVDVNKMILLEQCYFDSPIAGGNSRFVTLSLAGSVFADYIDMRGAIIDGGLFLRWGFKSLTSALFRDVVVKGPIDCDGALFAYDQGKRIDPAFAERHARGECFSLARSTASALFWRNLPKPPQGIVNLRNCRIGSFRDDLKSAADVARDWPEAGKLRLSGLKYEERTSTDPEALLAWIKLQDTTENRFATYQTAIRVLLDSGHELAADKLILEKHRFIAKNEPKTFNRIMRLIYIGFTDAGINTQKIVGITVAAFACSWLLVFVADRAGGFAPKSTEVVKDECYLQPSKCTKTDWVAYRDRKLPVYYPKFNSFGYTVDVFMPVVNYGVSADWRPSGEASSALTALIRVVGFVCTGLVVLCLSGISRFSR